MSDISNISTIRADNLEQVLLREGVIASVTVGISMRPLFKTRRDMVVIRAADGVLSKYDVALYKVGSRFVFHRVIGVDTSRGLYRIRGDNTYKIEIVPFDSVIGVLESFNRKGKRVSVCDRGYRFYSRFWNAIYPIRYAVRLPYVGLRRILRPIKRAIKNSRSAE